MTNALSRFANFLRSQKFYRIVLIIFAFEAVWIAVSAIYPQAFDENYHFGLIQIYSHHWLPFISSQPAHANAFGAVSVNSSYLYHYLMSFPYRFIALFTKDTTVQVIFLRLINVALFTWGITLFRKVLLRVGASYALTNLILMLFVLIPIVPQLAGQINYDNLMIPLTALALVLSFRAIDEVKVKKPSVWTISLLITECLLTSLVKFAFLPIFAAIAIYMLVLVYRTYRHELKTFFSDLIKNWHYQSVLAKVIITVALIIGFGLFIQKDGINIIKYHTVNPDCAKVLTVKQCLSYSPWAYNYKQHQKLVGTTHKFTNPLIYAVQWLYWMWYRLFFAVNGPNNRYVNYPPMPLPSAATLLLFILGIVALFKWGHNLFRGNLKLLLLLVVTVFYLVALFGQGYASYRYTDVLENMNGRYLVPVIMLAAVMLGMAISITLRHTQNRKAVFALITLLFFFEGGGIFTFILRSDPSWDVDNKAVVTVNDTARKVLKPVIVKGRKTYNTSVWFFN